MLGPLEVTDGGRPLALGGPRQRLVLASLILEANHVVPTDRLIDRIWGDEPPDAARSALFSYISRLRKLLGAGRIQARPPGYILLAERSEVDALRFADLVNEAREKTEDREAARALLANALELWRGSALSDLAGHDALQPAITRLDESRIDALEQRVGAEIDLGRHRESVAALETLTAEHPLRERLWILLMVALYRSDRQGDALGAFHRARTLLVEELGIDPSPELRRVHEQVLRQEPALDLTPTTPAPADAIPQGDQSERDMAGGPSSTVVDRARDRGFKRVAAIGGSAVVLVASLIGAWSLAAGPRGLPVAHWTLGLDMPLSGGRAYLGQPVRNAVQMAVDDVNAAGGIDGSTIELVVLDDAEDPERAAANARSFVSDPTTLAMIGPWGSAATFPVIPITNAAGLLQCSPASTHPGLTKPRFGALDLRASRPQAINYLRVAPSDDIQASALAAFAYRDLAAAAALVIDDTAVGRDIADAFETEFKGLGGITVRRALNPGAEPKTVITPLAESNAPTVVFYGGEAATGAAVRRAMVEDGRASTPLLTWDFLRDGSGADDGSYIRRLGAEVATGSFAAHASLPDHKFSFADAFRQRFGAEPDEYAAAAYACVEIIVAAMQGIAPRGPAVHEVRELVRAFAVDSSRRYETILGTVGFDGNGDALQQFVTFYRIEPSAAGGAGDWVIFKKQDYGPAP